jgi:hypothetical protein
MKADKPRIVTFGTGELARMAGVSTQTMRRRLKSAGVVRKLPNGRFITTPRKLANDLPEYWEPIALDSWGDREL